jgi:hypothetical protein
LAIVFSNRLPGGDAEVVPRSYQILSVVRKELKPVWANLVTTFFGKESQLPVTDTGILGKIGVGSRRKG